MIQLSSDCLMFQMSSGETVPCSAELVTIELIGDAASELDPDVIKNAAAAVLHYFKHEQGRTAVSVPEFSSALEAVLRGLGHTVLAEGDAASGKRLAPADLLKLASESGTGCELFFFPRLRDALRHQLNRSPGLVRFHGLRGCAKQLVGARRWTTRCERMSDRIVDFLRTSLYAESPGDRCALVVV
jgi:hypothetical protein